MKRILKKTLLEYGTKGQWKSEWTKDDQTLAMYNSRYGVEGLPMDDKQIASDIIGTSLSSFNQQTSNFTYLDTGEGLSRPNTLQTIVYDMYKDYTKHQLKDVCLKIIDEKIENPDESVIKMKLGKEIGDKRDNIEKERSIGFEKIGKNYDPKKWTFQGRRPKVNDNTDDEIEDTPTAKNLTPKDDVVDFISKLYNKVKDTHPELADDLDFISKYIDSELTNKETLSEIFKIFKQQINESKNQSNVVKLKKSHIKGVIKNLNKRGIYYDYFLN